MRPASFLCVSYLRLFGLNVLGYMFHLLQRCSSCLWSLRTFPSLPGSPRRFYRDSSSSHILTFFPLRKREENKLARAILVRIGLTNPHLYILSYSAGNISISSESTRLSTQATNLPAHEYVTLVVGERCCALLRGVSSPTGALSISG